MAGRAETPALDARAVEPLTARSVALSTLLGYHPPTLPVSALIQVGRLFEIDDRAMRVALSRMARSGDIETADGMYRLSRRLLARQARQDATRSPATKKWGGGWVMAVVTATQRPLAERISLRRAMTALRLAELREGVWLRPDNLEQGLPEIVTAQCTFFESRPAETNADAIALAAKLWDLPGWAERARHLTGMLTVTSDLRDGFMASVEVIRHLMLDPCLPAPLLPPKWPATLLRTEYDRFHTLFAARLREYSQG